MLYRRQKGAQSKLKMEEYAEITEQSSNYAVAMGAIEKPKMEEFASNMEPRSNYATTPEDVQIMPRRVESVSNTVQRSNASCAAMRDVPTLLNGEECANDTARRLKYAEPWVVQIKLSREEYAEGMGQRQNRNCVTLREGVQI